MTEVRFPQMRSEIILAVKALADPDYQWSAWVRHELPPGHFDDFTHQIHILYDDTQVLESPYSAVGLYLRSPDEAAAMQALARAIDNLFAQLGTELSDEEYLKSASWTSVVEAARAAQRALERASSEEES